MISSQLSTDKIIVTISKIIWLFEANFEHAMHCFIFEIGMMNVDSLFQDKPWVYAHLLEIQRRVGRENFPLIDQVFYPSHRDMVSSSIS